MTPKEQLAAARRFAGKKSKAQGDYFEAMIEAGCNFYRDRKVADIEKTPEPMRPIKDLGAGSSSPTIPRRPRRTSKASCLGAGPSCLRRSTRTPAEWSRTG